MIKFRILRWAEHVSRIEVRSAFNILSGKPIGKMPLGRPRRRCEENIGMDLKETGVNTGTVLNRLRIRIIGEPFVIEPQDSVSHDIS